MFHGFPSPLNFHDFHLWWSPKSLSRVLLDSEHMLLQWSGSSVSLPLLNFSLILSSSYGVICPLISYHLPFSFRLVWFRFVCLTSWNAANSRCFIFFLPFTTLHVNPVRKSPSRTVRRGVNVKSVGQIHSAQNENGRTRFVNWCSNLFLCSRLSTVLTSNCEKNSPKLSLHVAQAKDEPWQTCLSARHFKLKLEVSKLRQCEIPNKDIVFYGMTWLNFALKRTRNHWW